MFSMLVNDIRPELVTQTQLMSNIRVRHRSSQHRQPVLHQLYDDLVSNYSIIIIIII